MGNSIFGSGRYGEEQGTDGFRMGLMGESEAAATVSGGHDSTEKFKKFVVNEFIKSTNTVGDKFTEFMKSRDSELAKLEVEIEKLRPLQRDNEQLEKAVKNSRDAIFTLSNEMKSKQQVIDDQTQELEKCRQSVVILEKKLKAKNDENLKLNKLLDPMRELRRKGHCIQPKDVLHDDVAKDFNQLFGQKKLFEPIGIKEAGERASELTKLFEIAYHACKNRVIEIAKEELDKLFQPPLRVLTEQERNNEDIYLPWQSRQEALSLLLSNLEIQSMPDDLTVEVTKEDKMYESADMQTVVKQVIELTWKMVKLSPPVSFGKLSFSEDLDLHDVTDMKNLLGERKKYVVKYRRPILFFGPLGIVGYKGSVAIDSPPPAEHSTPVEPGMLIEDVSGVDDDAPEVTDLTKEEKCKKDKVKEMVDKAACLVWDMVTIVPPAIVYQPTKPCESIQVTNASSKDITSTMIIESGNFQSLQQVPLDEKSGDAAKFDSCFTFTSADEDVASLLPYLRSVNLREPSVDAALQNIQDPKDEVVNTQCSNFGMAVSQNTLLSNSKDVDGSYDDRNALALGPNKDNSDLEESSDRVTPICDRPDGDVIHSPGLNIEELSDNNLLLLEVNRLCHNIDIGDITHESVCLSFNEYFVKFNRQFKQLVRSQDPVQSVICLVVQTAYKLCVKYILEGSVMQAFIDSPDSTLNQLPKAVKEILLSRNVTNYLLL
uniref:Uncharacterized protein n=1 Tax=Amphimedon queenslandica TaxID=400682 RepID=A0A1X7TIB8_AMPQE